MLFARFWASLVAALLIPAPLWAQEESVHLDYEASAGCPDRASFIAEINARTARARFVDAAGDVRTFRVSIRTEGDRTSGSLTSNSGQTGAERRVNGKTCLEVVSALALITALAIDPSASTSPSPSVAGPEGPASPEPKATAPTSTNPSSPPPVAPVPANGGPSSWGLAVGAEGEGSYGFATEGALTMLGGSLHAEVGPLMRERRGPLFRVGALLLQSATTVRPPDDWSLGGATFNLVGAQLAGSPLYIRIGSAFELHPWLSVESGRLNGSAKTSPGDRVTSRSDGWVPWLAIGQAVEARWSLGDSLWLTLNLRAAESLLRPKFTFTYRPKPTATTETVTTITSVPFLEGVLGVGIGGRIL